MFLSHLSSGYWLCIGQWAVVMKTCKMNQNYIHQLGSILSNVVYPLKQRFRALFTLKNFGDDLSVRCIGECFNDSSALLKHELAYCLGQMGNVSAIPYLIEVLEDNDQEVVVRHEAAEALGAIGHNSVVEMLKKYTQCGVQEIAETCELSLGRLNYFAQGGQTYANVYGSIDPAPASEETNIQVLENVYVNERTDMFDRYRAMFALRNMNSEESIRILTKGFSFKSVLFRHEVAFVLGQLQNPVSIPDLKKAVENEHENNMVRHEAIEALGAIGKPECFEIIKSYVKDDDALVRESCEVALDIHTYQNSSEFQYANGLEFINCIG